MKKLFIYAILIGFVLLLFPSTTFGYGREKHDDELIYVLLGDEKVFENQPDNIKNILISLQNATYLCVDQFNYARQKESDDASLAFLKKRGIPNLPKDVKEINYNEWGEKHRFYTHRGWEHKYTEKELNKSHWLIRKQILINTVKKEFDPGIVNYALSVFGNKKSSSITTNIDKKCEALSELLYYIHLLGDHAYDNKTLSEKVEKEGLHPDSAYKIKDVIIKIGGSNDQETIVAELKKCLNVLFSDQKSKLSPLISEIEGIDRSIYKVQRNEGGINTVGKYLLYSASAQQLLDTLHTHIPDMLQKEDFFVRVIPL